MGGMSRHAPNMSADFRVCPDRIIDNLLKPGVTISVASWKKINEPTLELLIESAFSNRSNCEYDLGRPMRRANS